MDKRLEALRKIKEFVTHVYEYNYDTEEANALAAHVYARTLRYLGGSDEDS